MVEGGPELVGSGGEVGVGGIVCCSWGALLVKNDSE